MTAILWTDSLVKLDSKQAFDQLFLAHYDRVYGILFRLLGNRDEAEDIAQEVFLKLYQNPPANQQNIAGWLYRVATNLGYNAIRDRKRLWSRQRWLVESEPMPPSSQQVESAEERDLVRQVLAKMTPQQGQLLLLRHMGMSYAEIAEAVGVKQSSVGKMLERASSTFEQTYLSMTMEQTNA